MIHREEGMICKVQRQLKQMTFLGDSNDKATRAHRKPPKHGELTVQEQASPCMGAPLRETADGRPYRDTKSGGTGIRE